MKALIHMKRLCGLLLAAAAFALAPATQAATLSIGSANGAAGDTVTVLLSLDDTPIDEFGLFSLDVDLGFDPALLSIVAIRDGSLAAGADFFTSGAATAPITASPLTLNIIGSFAAAPGAGSLVELDFQLAAGATPGQSSVLDLVFVDASSPALGAGNLVDGAITVVPLPMGVWLLASGLACLGGSARRRNTLKHDE